MHTLAFIKKMTPFLVLLLLATACYKMPTDEDYTTIPTTNNPDITRDKGGWQPNVSY